jgi:hypothetical protein
MPWSACTRYVQKNCGFHYFQDHHPSLIRKDTILHHRRNLGVVACLFGSQCLLVYCVSRLMAECYLLLSSYFAWYNNVAVTLDWFSIGSICVYTVDFPMTLLSCVVQFDVVCLRHVVKWIQIGVAPPLLSLCVWSFNLLLIFVYY